MNRRILPSAIDRAVLAGHRWRRLATIALGALLAILTVVVTDAPATASTIFTDGFESGDLSNCTANFGLVAQQQDVFAGMWAARAQASASRAYAYEQLPSATPELTAGTRFDVVSNSTPVVLLRLQTASGSNLMT